MYILGNCAYQRCHFDLNQNLTCLMAIYIVHSSLANDKTCDHELTLTLKCTEHHN